MSRQPWARWMAAVWFVTAAIASAKDDRPRLILHTKGSAGPISAMAFSGDSGRLIVAGQDKVAHVWTLREAEGAMRGVVSRTLRWEFGRGLRGAAYAMAVSPRDEVAVGGYGARDIGGDVIVLDAGTGLIRRSLPNWNEAGRTADGHVVTIVSLDYSPDGRQLVSTSKDGEVRVWTAGDQVDAPWESARLRVPAGEHETYQPALFLDDTTLAVTERDPRSDNWRIAVFDRTDRGFVRRRVPLAGHSGRITALARRPLGRQWASADERGRVIVWSEARNPVASVLRNGGRTPLDLSFSRNGELVAGCALDDRDQAVAEIWDTGRRQLLDQVAMSRRSGIRATAVSPDGRLLALQDPDTNHVSVYRLRTPTDDVVAKPLQQKPTILDSRGRSVTNVAFAADGSHRVAFGTERTGQAINEYGPLAAAFDFDAARLLAKFPADVEWRKPTAGAGPWTVRVDATRTIVELQNAGRAVGRIELDRVQQGLATCFCMVHDARGVPFAVAVGTAEQSGIYVYALPAGGRPPQLLRYYRDHGGDVRALGISADGTLLVSGSDDQQIKVWSLAGLQRTSPTFSKVSAWGADFVSRTGELTVERTEERGIARSRNIRDGDVLVSVRTAAGEFKDARGMREALEQLPLFQTTLLQARRGNDLLDPVVIVPGWEPLLSLFVDVRGEWAAFTPLGAYDASVADGNELFGWQVNRGPNVTPRVFAAAELQQEFERPDLIRGLFGAAPAARNDPDDLANVIARVPDVSILAPRTGDAAEPGKPVEVVAEVSFANAEQAKAFEVRGLVNGIALTNPVVVGRDGLVHTYRWSTLAPDARNVFYVFAETKDGTPDALMKQDRVTINGTPGTERYRLHVLALAVKEYPEIGEFGSLRYSVGDAEALTNLLRAKRGRFYDLDVGHVHALHDAAVHRAGVDAEIAKLRGQLANANADDLLVIYLSGHGFAHGSEYYFVPGHVSESKRNVLEKEAIPWHRLRSLADLPCRKIVLLDTCYAGNVQLAVNVPQPNAVPGEAAAPRADSRTNVGSFGDSFKRYGFLVLMSTDVDEIAEEGEEYGGHGAFTESLLLGLEGQADRNGDRSVSLTELVRFTRVSVAERTLDAQQPVFMSHEVFDAIDTLQLVEAPGR